MCTYRQFTKDTLTIHSVPTSATMSSVNYSAAELFALQTLAIQNPGNICMTIVASTAVVFNILILTTISKTKELKQSKSMCILGSLALAEIFQSLNYAAIGIKRVLYAELQRLDNVSQLSCIGQSFGTVLLISTVANFTVALALDRFIALSFPTKYIKLDTKRYIFLINFVSWGYSFVLAGLAFIDYDKNRIMPMCTGAAAFSQIYLPAYFGETDAKIVLTITVSVLTAFALYRRVSLMRQMPEPQRRAERQKLELGTLRTVLVIAFLYLISIAVTFFGSSLLTGLSNELKVRYVSVFGSFVAFNSSTHLIVYLSMSTVFKKSFKTVFCSSTISVGQWTGPS